MEKHLLDILQATFLNLIIVGALLSIIYGIWLLIAPQNALVINKKINKSFSMRKSTKILEKPIFIESWFYKHAKITGSLLMLGSVYLFYLLFWSLDFAQIAKIMPNLSTFIWEWLLQAFQIFFAIMSVAVFLMGFLVLIRPSLLKPLEEKANKWVSTRQNLQFMSDEIGKADKLLELFPRQIGAIIIVAATIVLLNMNKFNV